jgi:iron(III) transport system substrate-binding protein
MLKPLAFAAGAAALLSVASPVFAADDAIRVYAGRFNEEVAKVFTAKTGIAVEIVKGEFDEITDGILAENPQVADVVIAGDLAGMARLQQRGVFEPVQSAAIDAQIPAALRDPAGEWFATFRRARVIFYNPNLVAAPPRNYADLAGPDYRGKVCIGSGGSGYNLAFISGMVASIGAEATQAFVRDYVANDAGAAQGHDPVQILNVGKGDCAATIVNHYYFLNLKADDKPENRDALAKVELVWPDQDGDGVVGNSGAAGLARNAANRDGAVAFLEFLASDEGQQMLAGRAFFPAATNVQPSAAVQELGAPRWSQQSAADAIAHLAQARELVEAAAWPSAPPRAPR